MSYKVKSDHYRDTAIADTFMKMRDTEIERLFRTAGGLYAEHCFSERSAPSVICERPDRWILEVRYGDIGNNVWIKATTKTISDLERIWVLDWFETLGFDPAEAIVYFNSNVPRKRDIADKVGRVLTMLRQQPELVLPNVSPENRAANQVLASLDSLVSALQTSGRISYLAELALPVQ